MGKWMPYITGGYANAAYHFYGRTIGTQIQNEEARARLSGWFIGGGVEMALSHGWTVGLEYRHYEFDDKIATAFTPGWDCSSSQHSSMTPPWIALRSARAGSSVVQNLLGL